MAKSAYIHQCPNYRVCRDKNGVPSWVEKGICPQCKVIWYEDAEGNRVDPKDVFTDDDGKS